MKLLFVCEYNACRSQMAEGLARRFLSPAVEIMSAGVFPGELNQFTVEVMREVGIDIAHHQSQQLGLVAHHHFDAVIVLADAAYERTKMLNAKKRLLWSFPDPVAQPGTNEELKAKIRTVRDDLRKRIVAFGKERGC